MHVVSQISLKDLEIVGLKIQNRNLVDAALKRQEEISVVEDKYKEVLDKNDNLVKQLTRQLPIQRARHLIWDMIIVEAIKLRPYTIP